MQKTLLALLATLPAVCHSDIYVLSDVTPAYYLTDRVISPYEPGNEQLFDYLTERAVNGGGVYVSGRLPNDDFGIALEEFLGLRGLSMQTLEHELQGQLQQNDLLILVNPGPTFSEGYIAQIRDHLGRNGRLLLIVEGNMLAGDVVQDGQRLLSLIGSSMTLSDARVTPGDHIARAAEPLSSHLSDPVYFGAMHPIRGGQPILHDQAGNVLLAWEPTANTQD